MNTSRTSLPYIMIATILFVACVPHAQADSCTTRSYFEPRSLSFNAMLELGMSNYYTYHNMIDYDDTFIVTIEATPFYMSSNNASDISKYLFPSNSSFLSVKENGLGDIGSEWIGLTGQAGDPFSSTLCFAPGRTAFGAHLNFYLNFDEFFENVWGNVAFAAMSSKHTLRAREITGSVSGEEQESALQAFDNPEWCYGRLSSKTLSASGVDDVELKLGYNWYWADENHFGLYAIAGVPTGKGDRVQNLFQPIIGSNHGSLGLGFNADCGSWIADEQFINFMIDAHYRYIWSARELRSFDLCANGEWSRYLEVVTPEDRATPAPGINFFTREVTVCPGSRFQLWTAVHYEVYQWNFEVGYNYWWRNREHLCELHLDETRAIFDLAGPENDKISASKANITQSSIGPNAAPRDEFFTPISSVDFNLMSAAHPRTSTHTLYGGIGYSGEVDNCPSLVGIGGSYEFARNGAALEQWAVWGKLGIGF